VIDVGVRVHEMLGPDAERVEARDDALGLIPAIDHDRFAARRVGHDRTITT
jgi:hypothetical protein